MSMVLSYRDRVQLKMPSCSGMRPSAATGPSTPVPTAVQASHVLEPKSELAVKDLNLGLQYLLRCEGVCYI